VSFESSPSGAAVYLDGKHIGETPVETRIEFPHGGSKSKDAMRIRAVRMELDGYERASRFISIKDAPQKEETNTVSIRLDPLVFTYRLQLSSTPSGAGVLVDGKETDLTTPCEIEREFVRDTRFERPRITLTISGYDDYWVDIDPSLLASNGTLERHAILSKH